MSDMRDIVWQAEQKLMLHTRRAFQQAASITGEDYHRNAAAEWATILLALHAYKGPTP